MKVPNILVQSFSIFAHKTSVPVWAKLTQSDEAPIKSTLKAVRSASVQISADGKIAVNTLPRSTSLSTEIDLFEGRLFCQRPPEGRFLYIGMRRSYFTGDPALGRPNLMRGKGVAASKILCGRPVGGYLEPIRKDCFGVLQ
jgi:hypothetical protein